MNLMQGAIVVFESTVYPGVTEAGYLCSHIEKEPDPKCGVDWKVDYSPELYQSK